MIVFSIFSTSPYQSVHSFHNSEVEVYPVHPRVVETSFRERAASVATEFRTRVNSVTQMKKEGEEIGRLRSATVNGTLLAEGNVKSKFNRGKETVFFAATNYAEMILAWLGTYSGAPLERTH